MKHNKIIATILTATTLLATPGIASTTNDAVPFVSEITASAALASNEVIVSGLVYALDYTNKTATLKGRYSNLTTITVPATIKSNNVTYKVTSIYGSAFDENVTIKQVDMSKATYLESIGYAAFRDSKGLTKVTLSPSTKTIGGYAFTGCTALSTFNFNGNNKITKLDYNIFQNCTSLQSISLPYSLTYIGKECFENTLLSSITIPGQVTIVAAEAFNNCPMLKNVTFQASGDATAKLDLLMDSFANCKSLETVRFDRRSINAAIDVFEGSNENVSMVGYGASDYTQSLCQKLLKKWGITYNPKGTNAEKKAAIDKLAKAIHSYITYEGIAEEGCAATVLSTRKGTCGGYARAFYNCALAMGMTQKEVLVGGDAHCHAWNYVKVNGKWYNYDCTNQFYYYTDSQYSKIMISNWGSVSQHTNPSRWVVCADNQTGSSDETDYSNPRHYNYDKYLSDFNLGTRAK